MTRSLMPPLLRLELPGHYIGVVLHDRDDDLVALVHESFGKGRCHEVETLGGAAGEHYLGRRGGMDKAAHRLAGGLVQLGGLLRHPVYATVYVGVDVKVLIAHGIEYTQGFLGGGTVV